MDFKKVLEEWKNYQENKLVMANRFNCEVTLRGMTFMGSVTFTGSGEEKIIYFQDTEREVEAKIPYNDIVGTAPGGTQIIFNRRNGTTILVQFPSRQMRKAAHRKFLQVDREEFGPTPPSSGESGSSDD